MNTLVKFFTSILLLLLFSAAVAHGAGLPLLPVVGVFLALSLFVKAPQGALRGVVLEQWAAYIVERFWKDNAFLKYAYDDSQYVVGGRIIHIPQPGSKPVVQKNRSSFPGVAVRRSDTDVVYSLDEYTTDPTHIPNIDAIHLSYSKQDSVLGDHMQVLDETVADDMLIKWGGGATVIKTSGGGNTGQVSPVGGQTGNRLGLHHRDLKSLMIKANTDNVPKTDRHCLIDDNMYEFFYDSLSETQQRDFSRYLDAENGIVGKIHGWNVHTRSAVLAAASNDSIKALGAVLGATDNLGCLAWQKSSVAFAIGDKKLFQDKDSAIYYGDVHSALLMAGGRVRRGDGKGIYAILQGTPTP